VSIPDDKAVFLSGAGYESTVITLNSSGAYLGLNKSGSRVSGFGFVANTDVQMIQVKGTGWRIDHCKFENTSKQSAEGVYVNPSSTDGHAIGVIDHCVFIESRINVLGSKKTLAHHIWAEPLGLGTNNAVFVEDCEFTRTFGNAIDAHYGGRYVFRYNTVNDCYVESHAVQENDRGARSWEIYNNTFNQVNESMWVPVFMRAGTGVVFNNTINGMWSNTPAGLALNSRRSCESFPTPGLCDGSSSWDGNEVGEGGYPCRDQPGRSTDKWLWTDKDPYPPQELDPCYCWNNKHEGKDVVFFPHDLCSSGHIKEGRDYFNNVKRPGYTPYTYPHPLIQEWGIGTGNGTGTVLPPKSLRIRE
jgi:hypothetical protein